MSRSKFQVAALSGLMVGGALILQEAMPQVAHAFGLTYLRAEYRLAKGDKTPAMELMRASQPSPALKPVTTVATERVPEACPRTPKVKPVTRLMTATKNQTMRIQVAGMRAPVTIELPTIPAMAPAATRERYEKQMRSLEAKLRNLRVYPAASWDSTLPAAAN